MKEVQGMVGRYASINPITYNSCTQPGGYGTQSKLMARGKLRTVSVAMHISHSSTWVTFSSIDINRWLPNRANQPRSNFSWLEISLRSLNLTWASLGCMGLNSPPRKGCHTLQSALSNSSHIPLNFEMSPLTNNSTHHHSLHDTNHHPGCINTT